MKPAKVLHQQISWNLLVVLVLAKLFQIFPDASRNSSSVYVCVPRSGFRTTFSDCSFAEE